MAPSREQNTDEGEVPDPNVDIRQTQLWLSVDDPSILSVAETVIINNQNQVSQGHDRGRGDSTDNLRGRRFASKSIAYALRIIHTTRVRDDYQVACVCAHLDSVGLHPVVRLSATEAEAVDHLSTGAMRPSRNRLP